jgi:hypothetical protein
MAYGDEGYFYRLRGEKSCVGATDKQGNPENPNAKPQTLLCVVDHDDYVLAIRLNSPKLIRSVYRDFPWRFLAVFDQSSIVNNNWSSELDQLYENRRVQIQSNFRLYKNPSLLDLSNIRKIEVQGMADGWQLLPNQEQTRTIDPSVVRNFICEIFTP